MSGKLKYTSMELASMSVLLIVIGAIAFTAFSRGCRNSEIQTTNSRCDSITSIIEKSSAANVDSIAGKTKKKKTKKRAESRGIQKPHERNYLDEPANE